jgi:hypothetical protein
MSEADLLRQHAKEGVHGSSTVKSENEKELFLEIANQLQSEGVAVTHDVFAVVKATVDLTKEILEKGRI